MAKRYPLDILISVTDKASAALNRVADRIERRFKPFADLRKSIGNFADQSGLAGVGTALKNVGAEALAVGRRVAIGLTVATAAIAAFTLQHVNAADAIGDTAARLNISTDALQAYQFGFQRADVDQQAFISSLDTLNKNLGLAKIGLGKALPLFRGLALDPRKFKTIDELLPVLAQRLSRIPDPAKRAAIASRLLGEAGAQMAVKLAEGPKALEEMMSAARKAGVLLRADTIEAAGELDERLKSLRSTFQGVAGNALGQLYPALIRIAEGVQAAIIRYQPQIEAFATQFAQRLPVYIDRTIDALRGLRDAFEPIASLIGFLVEKFGAGNVVIGAFAVLVGGKLIAALYGLGTSLVALGASMSAAFVVPALIVAAVAAAVAAGWWLYKNWDKVSDAIGGTIEQIVINFTLAWERVKKGAVSAFEWLIDKLKMIWENSPLGLMFRGIGWVADRVGDAMGGGAAPVASAAPVGGGLLAGGPRRDYVTVKVDLSNLPPGARTSASASDGMALDLSRGWAMPGVAY
jgi:phage-related minor tail protein